MGEVTGTPPAHDRDLREFIRQRGLAGVNWQYVQMRSPEMGSRVFLIIVAVFYLVFGLGMLLTPGECLAFYGIAQDAGTLLVSRIVGACLVGLAVTLWYARDTDLAMELEGAAKGVVYGACTVNVLGAIIAVWATVSGQMAATGWVAAILHAVIAAGLMYFAEFSRTRTA